MTVLHRVYQEIFKFSILTIKTTLESDITTKRYSILQKKENVDSIEASHHLVQHLLVAYYRTSFSYNFQRLYISMLAKVFVKTKARVCAERKREMSTQLPYFI